MKAMNKFKKLLSYIVLLLDLNKAAAAVNNAKSVSELDEVAFAIFVKESCKK